MRPRGGTAALLLQLALVSGVLSFARAWNFAETNYNSLCTSMKVTDGALKQKLRKLAYTEVTYSILTLLVQSFVNEDLPTYVEAVTSVGTAAQENQFQYEVLSQLILLTSRFQNRAQIVKKAVEYGTSEWWRYVFFEDNTAMFDLGQIVPWITSKHRYKYTFSIFKNWLSAKTDYLRVRHCKESTVMYLLKFEAERMVPFENEEDFKRMFDIVCKKDPVYLPGFLAHEEFQNVEPKLILTFLEDEADLFGALKSYTMTTWSVSVAGSELAKCRNADCVKHTGKLITKAESFGSRGLNPTCLALIKRAGLRAGIEKNSMTIFLTFFLLEPRYMERCDQSYADMLVTAYRLQELKGRAFLSAARYETTTVPSVMLSCAAAKEEGWSAADLNRLLTAIHRAKLELNDASRFLPVTGLSTVDEYLELLELYVASEKKDIAWMQRLDKLDVRLLVEIARSGPKPKEAVRVYFKHNLYRCSVESVKAVGNYAPIYFYEKEFVDFFNEVCPKLDRALPLLTEGLAKSPRTPFTEIRTKIKAL